MEEIGTFESNIMDISNAVKDQTVKIGQMNKSISGKVNENNHKMDKLASTLSK